MLSGLLRPLAYLVFAAGLWLTASTIASADTRVALVIGNADYARVGTLENPINDATDLAAALTRIGFDVTLATDLDINGMRTTLRAFRDKAQGADMSLVYFAGHGIEINKVNYLIPVDADLQSDSDVLFDTIPLDLMTEAVSGATTLRMVILDACRNNPFLGKLKPGGTTGRAIGEAGLSPFEPLGGTLVAFSAKGGTVALDGTGRNSPFMKGLLAHIEEPGLDVSLLFRKVRDSVLAETNNLQEPFTYGSLPGRELYLVPPVEVAASAPPTTTTTQAPLPQSMVPADAEEFAWTHIKNSTDRADFQAFVQTFPRGVHVGEAFDRIVALTGTTNAPPTEPAPAPATPVTPTAEPTAVVVAIQSELSRAGCDPGPLDGVWGSKSRIALVRFRDRAGMTLANTEPTEDLLAALQGYPGSVCTASAPPSTAVAEASETPAPQVASQAADGDSPMIAGCTVFPADNIWNTRVDALPVAERSADYVASIGAGENLQPDFGAGLYEGSPIGAPFVVVPFQQPKVEIVFAGRDGEDPTPDESDAGPFPIPADAPIEGGPDGSGDRHVIVVQEGSCTLFELYKAAPNPDGSWNAVGSAKFDLESNELRLDGMTSADAAGLPIFAGLVRADEVAAGVINHALRFTAPRTRNAYIWPARHRASALDDPALPPLGQRFRLKADVDISGFSAANQVILRALKTYGMILADNGSPWFLSGAPDDAWNNDDLHELTAISGSDFEAVDTSGLMVDADTGAARDPEEVVAALESRALGSETEPEKGSPASAGCYDVTVIVSERDQNGEAWDPWGGKRANPDPVIVEQTSGARTACDDTFTCALRVSPATPELSFLIEDDDADAPDPIGAGQCKAGKNCTLGSATLSMSPC